MAVDLRELELLIRGPHGLLYIEAAEEERAIAALRACAHRLSIAFHTWLPHRGLCLHGLVENAIAGTESPAGLLVHLERAPTDAIVHLRHATVLFESPTFVSHLEELAKRFSPSAGAIAFSGADRGEIPRALEPSTAVFALAPPSREEYAELVRQMLGDLRKRLRFNVTLSQAGGEKLLDHLRGLSLAEVRRVISQAILDDHVLDESDLGAVLDAKRRSIESTGILEYFPLEVAPEQLAGLAQLKAWLEKRASWFRARATAESFGLAAPRGLLLLGVQGCGKSLASKAIATSWSLPLVRLDPGAIYRKYVGESEQRLRTALSTAEALSPLVLWIDEIEKGFSSGQEHDGGVGQRLLGAFLSWMQERAGEVFVVATANDLSRLPPELLRKGRFDEIFFVDLPSLTDRQAILAVHLEKRSRAPAAFDLLAVATATEGFSGAELEQVVVSGLYTAFALRRDLSTEILLREAAATVPLSVTMREKVLELRAWAQGRAVPA